MGEVLKKFGRYFLLDHLAQGGMAEIYRARLATTDGAGRIIVIKKIQAGLGTNQEFLQMFKSEIKVTMGFNHPNIVQLYDFGEEDNQPFIAMELVDGRNLRQFMSRFSELKKLFPVELASHIIEQAASGLHYAHSFKDKISGAPLDIVHRDISPQNILISFEGNIKVIDFGIAKATTNSESTRAGVIKGKPSYLSPEQISGEILDGRSDIFALGAVLWEILTGKKLFAGENDLAVLKLIESCQSYVKPPSTLNSKIPKELDYIVLKSLAKQREKRYQTAEELQRDLHKFLYNFLPEFNPSDLAYYAKDLFKNEIVEDRKKIQKLNERAEHFISLDHIQSSHFNSDKHENTTHENEPTVLDSKSQPGHRIISHDKNEKIEIEPLRPEHALSSRPREARFGSSSIAQSTAPRRLPSPSSTETHSITRIFGLGGIAILILSIFGPEFGINIPILSTYLADWIGGSEARLILEGNQKGVTVAVNGQTVASNLPATLTGMPVGTPFNVTVNGSNGSFQEDVTLKKGERKSIVVSFSQEKSLKKEYKINSGTNSLGSNTILLRLNILPSGGLPIISLNGGSINIKNPVANAPLDAPLELSIDRNGFKSFKREFVLESRQMSGLKEWLMDITLEPIHFGFITIRTTPSADVTILFDGNPWKKKTPIENEKFPVGEYKMHLSNEVLGMEKTLSILVQEGRSVIIDERLEIKD